MASWLKRLRGILGLGAFGGAAGALFGGLWWLGSSVLGLGGIVFGPLGWTVALWGGFGAFAASGAGLLLTALGSRQTLEQLSPLRVGAFGLVMGFLAPPAYVFLMTGVFWGPTLSIVATISGVLGGALGSGLVLAAKRAPLDLPTGGQARVLGSGGNAGG